MSHPTEIKTQIKDIEALRSACQELGLTGHPSRTLEGVNDPDPTQDIACDSAGKLLFGSA